MREILLSIRHQFCPAFVLLRQRLEALTHDQA
jgi:hypothetical protein